MRAARRGAARRDTTSTRTVGCARVVDRKYASNARHARDHDASMIRRVHDARASYARHDRVRDARRGIAYERRNATRARMRTRAAGHARVGGRMSVSDAIMTSEWRVHDTHAFMMCARHARAIIAHVVRGVTWRAGGAARRDATQGGWLRARGGQDVC